jgi:hypothetical protein
MVTEEKTRSVGGLFSGRQRGAPQLEEVSHKERRTGRPREGNDLESGGGKPRFWRKEEREMS